MDELSLKLFGGLEVSRASAPPIEFRTRKAKALLAFLASPPGRAHTRDKLAAMFWENCDQDHARKNLRHTLALSRKAVSDKTIRIIVGDGDRLYLDPESVEVDAITFDRLVASGTPEALEQAMAIYQGGFLDGFELNEDTFLEWVTAERTRLHEKALAALTKLLENYLATGQVEQGIQVALKLLGDDPLQEWVHGALIRLYLQQERHGAALRQYESCREVFERELGIVPGPEIERLHQEIRSNRGRSEQSARRDSILGDGTAPEVQDVAHDQGYAASLSTFVGRAHELGLVMECWRRAEDGEGQVVHINGEPGIGKSRVVQMLQVRVSDRPHLRLRYHCSPFHTNSAFHPVIAQLTGSAGFAAADTPETRLDKLEALLAQSSDRVGDVAPLFAALLSIPSGQRYPDLQLSPQAHKERTMEALIAQVVALAARQPVLVIVEDAQWIDPTTEELFDRMIGQSQAAQILTVVAYRPEYSPPWEGNNRVTNLTLNQLSRRQAATLAENVARSVTLRRELNEQIVSRTDGVPLFVEELTKTVLEATGLFATKDRSRGGEQLPELAIPTSLRESLIARLDRLGPAKEVARVASVIGRGFSADLLAAVTGLDRFKLEEALDNLLAAELVFRRGSMVPKSFFFKHALVRDAAYEGLLHDERQRLHGAVAEALVRLHPEIANTEPELLAHHYTEAGEAATAIAHWQRAGEVAIERSANVEAANHLDRALELLEGLPETSDRDGQELELQLTLGAAMIAPKSYSSEDVRLAFARSYQLSRGVGDVDQRFMAVKGLWNCHNLRGEMSTARKLAGELANLAEDSREPDRLLMAQRVLALTHLGLGEYRKSLDACERGIELYDPDRQTTYLRLYGEDPGLFCYVYCVWTNYWLGYSDAASTRADQALKLARRLPSRYALSYVLALIADFFLWQRRHDEALECAYAAHEVAEEQSIVQWQAWADIVIGNALTAKGQLQEGLSRIVKGREAIRKIRGRFGLLLLAPTIADAYRDHGKYAEGLGVLEEAESILRESSMLQRVSEIYRLRGNLLEASGAVVDQSEAAYRVALDFARTQEAKTLELRAATDLARLWQTQGRKPEACDLLAPLYRWFTEGFDTPDLKDAKALLDELS